METTASVRQAFSLEGQVALVIGGGSGIGRTSAEVLAGAGAAVVAADLDPERAEETASAITTAGGRAVPASADVTDRAEVADLVDRVVSEQGRLDVLVNSAGLMVDARLLDVGEEELDRILAVNLKGTLFSCQAAGRVMVERRGGSIINMASAAVLAPAPEIGPYAITKAGVVQLTRTLALELGRRGVRVNAVAPGFVPTNMTARYYRREDGSIDEDLKEQMIGPMAKFTPLRRVGETNDIAYLVLYLASAASAWVTGQLISPNGGVTMH
jgi:3-oxoacyl-[acyl-carrier protein] reductase